MLCVVYHDLSDNQKLWILLSLTYYSYNSPGTTFFPSHYPEKLSDNLGENLVRTKLRLMFLN